MAAEQPEPTRAPGVRVKIVCSHCEQVIRRTTRKGYTVRCPGCGTVNAGPALRAEQGKPPASGALRTRTRRTRSAERRAEGAPDAQASPQAAAPVRRKRAPSASGAPSVPAEPARAEAAVPDGAPPSPRRGPLDRLMYGGED